MMWLDSTNNSGQRCDRRKKWQTDVTNTNVGVANKKAKTAFWANTDIREEPSTDGTNADELMIAADSSDSRTVHRPREYMTNAERERSRVQTLRTAFEDLQRSLPAVPASTKLSKLDILLLASTYIRYLSQLLQQDTPVFTAQYVGICLHPSNTMAKRNRNHLHPVKVS